MFKRIFLVVLDSVGIGEAKDASKFGDENTNTVKNILDTTKEKLPNLEKLGLINLINHTTLPTDSYYTRGIEISNGKDTLTGHLEMMGVVTKIPCKTFMDGFPKELVDQLEIETGKKFIGNKAASGTDIIEELGYEHLRSGALILYTSSDSVLQIAAHEDVIDIDRLYKVCEIARKITMNDEWKVGRIIARPFKGTKGNFERTPYRHDYALNPAHKTVLDNLKDNNYDVISIGKIADVFNDCGITKKVKTLSNLDGINKIIDTIKEEFNGLCFANLNDFDSKYGHRRDVEGYSKALKELDNNIPRILDYLRFDDLIIFTADHGNDPTYKGTDHTRENIPVLLYSKKLIGNGVIDNLKTFSDIGALVADNFKVESPNGVSFLSKLK